MNCISVYAETIPAIIIENTKIGEAYTENSHPEILEDTWQAVCEALDLPIMSNRPELMACINSYGNPVYVQPGELCADGSFWITIGYNHCEKLNPSCPNSSWTLSEDKKTCSRPDFSCIIDTDAVSEEKLLAAIAYGESSTRDDYEEMAGIAYATLRRRDAAKMPSLQALIKKYPSFSFVISDGNSRYRKLMCSDTEINLEKAYDAARNALNQGVDYANGGCFWDGYDLKTSGPRHYKYRHGFHFTNYKHNIFDVPEPPDRKITTKKGQYDYEYESVATHGKTIFWKLNNNFLNATGNKQCQ